MRFLVDAQLPPALATWLAARGHQAQAVRDAGLRGATDSAIWAAGLQQGAVIITKDEDFVERALQTTTGPQVVWLRIGNCTNRVLLTWLEPLLPGILRELSAGARVVEVKHA
jgi:predicted nuclease of predicted toxin-antitoxin system